MLTKNNIVSVLSEKQYDQSEYWVTAGAGLVMHGIKEKTRDIDIGCTSSLADHLIQNGAKWELLSDGTRKIEADGELEIFENWFVDEIIQIDAIPVASLKSIRKQKVALNREKDWDDIRLIDRFMNAD